MRRLKGYALLSVLIYLQVFTLMGLYAYANHGLLAPRIHRNWHHKVLQFEALFLLQQIEKNFLFSESSCIISRIADITGNTLVWWQQVGCVEQIAQDTYYYVIEFLGNDACARISYNTAMTADYYRISLFRLPTQIHDAILLQSTFIAENKMSVASCEGQQHAVNVGRQMWRLRSSAILS